MKIPNPYEKFDYRYFMLIPLLLLAVSAYFIPLIPKGIDMKGGLLITVQTDSLPDKAALEGVLAKFSNDASVRVFQTPAGNGAEIEMGSREDFDSARVLVDDSKQLVQQLDEAEVDALRANQSQASLARISSLKAAITKDAQEALKTMGSKAQLPTGAREASKLAEDELTKASDAYYSGVIEGIKTVAGVKSYSFKQVGADVSKDFFSKTINIILVAFALSSVVIFLIFRSIAPSLAVIFGAVADVGITAGFMGAFGIPLNLGAVATLLMLIGFSLDTDMLLTMRLIKRKEGNPRERAFDAMKTAFLMNLTTIAAFGILAVIGVILNIAVYTEIGLLAVVGGGVVDFVATWCFNAPLVLSFVEKKKWF